MTMPSRVASPGADDCGHPHWFDGRCLARPIVLALRIAACAQLHASHSASTHCRAIGRKSHRPRTDFAQENNPCNREAD